VRDDPFYFHSLGAWEKVACVCCAIGRSGSGANHRPSEKRSKPLASRIVDIESRATPTNDLAIVSSSRAERPSGRRTRGASSAAVPSASAAAACRAHHRALSGKKPAAAPIEQSAGVAPLAFIYVSSGCGAARLIMVIAALEFFALARIRCPTAKYAPPFAT
jgi:hypothetical protein